MRCTTTPRYALLFLLELVAVQRTGGQVHVTDPHSKEAKMLARYTEQLIDLSIIKITDIVIIYKNTTENERSLLVNGTVPLNPLADPKSVRIANKMMAVDPEIHEILLRPREKKGLGKDPARVAERKAAASGAPAPIQPWAQNSKGFILPWADRWACPFAAQFAAMIGLVCNSPPPPPPPTIPPTPPFSPTSPSLPPLYPLLPPTPSIPPTKLLHWPPPPTPNTPPPTKLLHGTPVAG
mmetsp:Transcript_35413/g.58662  ORF Transcript_35413/g.58662 Transcript_35413/m.58662 type:complete len:238 (+) Transcript_35413:67-780(+)